MGAHWFDMSAAALKFCDDVGHARADWVLRHGAEGTGVDDRENTSVEAVHGRHVLAARTEGAAYGWLGGKLAGLIWHWQMVDPVTDRKRPDQGDLWMGQVIIDVKAIPQHRLNLIANRNATIRDSWMYFLVCAEDAPRFCLYGWVRGTELAVAAIDTARMQKGRPARLISKDRLHDALELRTLGEKSLRALAPMAA